MDEKAMLDWVVIGKMFGVHMVPKVRKVIFNNPATIVFWEDGVKTVSKAHGIDRFGYSPRVGLLTCVAKRALGGTAQLARLMREWGVE